MLTSIPGGASAFRKCAARGSEHRCRISAGVNAPRPQWTKGCWDPCEDAQEVRDPEWDFGSLFFILISASSLPLPPCTLSFAHHFCKCKPQITTIYVYYAYYSGPNLVNDRYNNRLLQRQQNIGCISRYHRY